MRKLNVAINARPLQKVKYLQLQKNQIGNDGVWQLTEMLGALPSLVAIYLRDNKIRDEGMRYLSDALARGAAPALEEIGLSNNPASDAAKQAVKDMLEKRKVT